MSKRDYKEFAAGECYHVFNRGNDKKDLFRDQADYEFFLLRLLECLYPMASEGSSRVRSDGSERRKLLPVDSFDLLSYSLMPNHFHILLQQKTELPISSLMRNFISGFSKYFNKKYERVGSLFQDQFKSTHIEDNPQLLHTSAYIHLNARFAGLEDIPGKYRYSSYGEYIGESLIGRSICKKDIILSQFFDDRAYKSFVEESAELIQRNKDLRASLEN